MNVLLLGGGGREHAIARKLVESDKLKTLYAIPGNPGIESIAEVESSISVTDIDEILSFAKEKQVDLIFCGPEAPLVAGVTDAARNAGIPVFGPPQYAAQLEGSKLFAKEFMEKYNVPTAGFHKYTSYNDACEHVEKVTTYPIVIKADGLAAGKGVRIPVNKDEALATLEDFMVNKIFGDAGSTVVFEEFMTGEEMSLFYITDGKKFMQMIAAKDYKKAFDNDEGDNTGGMGSYAPHQSLSDSLQKQIDSMMEKIADGMIRENMDYRGVLYVGIMITPDGPKVVEFNCRFGDPETQVLMPLIDNDFLELTLAAARGDLGTRELAWKDIYAACVVIASGGYPGSYPKGKVISFETDPSDYIHAGTRFEGEEIVTSGGRVLNAVATGKTKAEALDNAYRLARQVQFDGAFYRKDIGS
jgi:phosphoribosylamine--glycine ligase